MPCIPVLTAVPLHPALISQTTHQFTVYEGTCLSGHGFHHACSCLGSSQALRVLPRRVPGLPGRAALTQPHTGFSARFLMWMHGVDSARDDGTSSSLNFANHSSFHPQGKWQKNICSLRLKPVLRRSSCRLKGRTAKGLRRWSGSPTPRWTPLPPPDLCSAQQLTDAARGPWCHDTLWRIAVGGRDEWKLKTLKKCSAVMSFLSGLKP